MYTLYEVRVGDLFKEGIELQGKTLEWLKWVKMTGAHTFQHILVS